jgi:hypothetical protein
VKKSITNFDNISFKLLQSHGNSPSISPSNISQIEMDASSSISRSPSPSHFQSLNNNNQKKGKKTNVSDIFIKRDSRSPSPILQYNSKTNNKINLVYQNQDVVQQLRKLPALPKSMQQTLKNRIFDENEIELINFENDFTNDKCKKDPIRTNPKGQSIQQNICKTKHVQQTNTKISSSNLKDISRLTKQSASLGDDDDSDENEKWF